MIINTAFPNILTLYDNGTQVAAWSQPSGLKYRGSSTTYSNTGTIAYGAISVVVNAPSGTCAAMATTAQISKSGYSKLCITYSTTKNGQVGIIPSLTGNINDIWTTYASLDTTSGFQTVEMSLSGVVSGYVCVCTFNNRSVTVQKIWLE